MDARKFSKVIVIIGTLLLVVALAWWFIYARDATSDTNISMGRLIRCIWSTEGRCASLKQLAGNSGIAAYEPLVFWAGVVVTMIGLVIGRVAVGGDQESGRESTFMLVGRTIGWLFLALGVGFLCWAVIPVLQGGRFEPEVLGKVWASIDAESLGALGPAIQRHIDPDLYTSVILPILTTPAYIDCLVLGAVLALIFRRRRGRKQ
jgi:hypothetical protein